MALIQSFPKLSVRSRQFSVHGAVIQGFVLRPVDSSLNLEAIRERPEAEN
jgi:hypothetical protein